MYLSSHLTEGLNLLTGLLTHRQKVIMHLSSHLTEGLDLLTGLLTIEEK